jgi:predicted AlkP superfamily phosphohydrolase/phosphomutase/Flp pilus assembly protein TadD
LPVRRGVDRTCRFPSIPPGLTEFVVAGVDLATRGVMARYRRLALCLLVALPTLILPWGGCSRKATEPILIVGVDGADWRIIGSLLQQGKLPNFERLIREGVSAPLTSLKPLVSPIIWTTIATGKEPNQHRVLDFTVPDPVSGEPIPVVGLHRRVKAFWDIFSERNVPVGVVAWWATWPAEEIRGCMVSDRLTSHAFINSPEATADVTYPPDFMDEIRPSLDGWEDVSYETTRDFLKISREEYEAHRSFDFKDLVTHFRHIHASMGNVKNVALKIWEDVHPRALAVYFEGVDTASHLFIRYAPPRLPNLPEEDLRRYATTVDSVYAYQDRLLGELLDAVGPEANVVVVSDHGFITGEERPLDASLDFNYATAPLWHRLDGVLILHGPGLRKGVELEKASIFDVTPTLLYMAGVPIGRDMKGRVLREAFAADSPEPDLIDSHEDPEWDAGRRRRLEQLTTARDPEVIERLRSLGYIGGGSGENVISLRGRLNLVQYYIWVGEKGKAERELHDLLSVAPDYAGVHYQLGVLKMEEEKWAEAEPFFRRVLELEAKNLSARKRLAYVLIWMDDLNGALQLMEETSEMYPLVPVVFTNLALLYMETGQPEKALDALGKASRLQPRSRNVLIQTGEVLESLQRWDEAVAAWRRALEVYPNDRTAREHLNRLDERRAGGAE